MRHDIRLIGDVETHRISVDPASIVVKPGDTICWIGQGVPEFALEFPNWPAESAPAAATVTDANEFCVEVGRVRSQATVSYNVTIGRDRTAPEIIFDPD